jgi:hypothetical protein
MTDERTDRIAREAARLMAVGEAQSIDQAIRRATESLDLPGAELPGRGRVRQHARAMSMQALGAAGYEESVRHVWRIAEELMTGLEQMFSDAKVMLVGRAVSGKIDAGATIHIRVYTEASITELATAVVEFGYEEPAFATADTRLGRLSQLKLSEDGVHVVVMRLLPHMHESRSVDLFTGERIEAADVAEVRRRLNGRA